MRPEVVLSRLRRFLLALSVALLAGAVAELWFVEHTEDPIQLIPFVLSGLGGAVAVVALLRPNRAALWALRAVMLLVVLGSLLGVYLHVESNYGLERELYPDRPAGQLLLGALGGANPLLAPGILAVAAVLALAATYQHPAIAKRGETQPLGKGESVIGRQGEAGKRDGAAAGNEVEAAGETTAAASVGGNNDAARPVGADTQVRVEGDAHPADEAGG